MVALRPALLGLLVLPVAVGCGSSFAHVEPDNPTRVADGLVFTRTDGSSYELDRAVAECVQNPTTGTEYVYLHVEDPEESGTSASPALVLEVVAGVTGTRELPLRDRTPPTSHVQGPGPVDLVLQGSDPRTGDQLQALGRQARGTVTVSEADCDPDPRLTIQIDAVLNSASGRPVKVTGGLTTLS